MTWRNRSGIEFGKNFIKAIIMTYVLNVLNGKGQGLTQNLRVAEESEARDIFTGATIAASLGAQDTSWTVELVKNNKVIAREVIEVKANQF